MRVYSVHLALLVYMYRLALAETPESERLRPDSEFRPNLVNSVTYMVEALVQVGRTLTFFWMFVMWYILWLLMAVWGMDTGILLINWL